MPESDTCQEKKKKWRMPRRISLTWQTGNLSPASTNNYCIESLGVCSPYHACAGDS